MKVNLLYFGLLKEHFGSERETIEIVSEARVSDVVGLLRKRPSNLDAGLWTSLAIAVNREYAGLPTVLQDGDEVALLPPVSGGFDAR